MTILEGNRKLCLNGCFTVKPVSDFTPHNRSPDGLSSLCKDCDRARLQRARHGLTSDEKAQIAMAQGGCPLCHRINPGGKGWVVDHDRSCCEGDRSCDACRRGVICQWCNSAMGYARDSPQVLRRMADYLESGQRLSELITHLTQSADSLLDPTNKRT